jgi:hypothetical protein
MTNNRNGLRRQRAQQVIHQHVNQRRNGNSLHDWNFVHVIHLTSFDGGGWMAVVLVEGLNQQMFQVTYNANPDGGETKVDTFTRQHASRFY